MSIVAPFHRLGVTHFVTTSTNTHRAFTLDTCEKCGCQAEGANAVTLKEPRSKLLALGMTQLPRELPELGYCDALDMAVCDACFVHEDE
jgi:hypothetical protein